MKYSVITFGCRVNQADSLAVVEELRAGGALSAAPDEADLVFVNTCSVTATADQSARQAIRRVARQNPNARIVVTGCYATRRPDEVRELPSVVTLVPNDDKPRMIALVGTEVGLTTVDRFGKGDGSCGAAIEPGVAGRTAFTLCIQTGCSEPCAYCVIPTTRGRPRSVAVDDLVQEIDRLAVAGYREIVLTGVHLGSYGRDLAPPSSLIALLRVLEEWGVNRLQPARGRGMSARERGPGSLSARDADLLFRLSSLEPMDCAGEIVDLVATSDRFAPHFHLPLQHASNAVLERMRRPYTIEQYSGLVNHIRSRVPHASIGSDLIVGFPGETDAEFEALSAYLEESPLTHLHVFPYSDRPETPASRMSGKVPGAVVRMRAQRLRGIGRRLNDRFRESQVGTIHRGLTLEDGSLVVTGNYLKVRIRPGHARNEWVSVRIVGTGDPMTGEAVQ